MGMAQKTSMDPGSFRGDPDVGKEWVTVTV